MRRHNSRIETNILLLIEVGYFFPDSTHREAGLRASRRRLGGAGGWGPGREAVSPGFYCQPFPIDSPCELGNR